MSETTAPVLLLLLALCGPEQINCRPTLPTRLPATRQGLSIPVGASPSQSLSSGALQGTAERSVRGLNGLHWGRVLWTVKQPTRRLSCQRFRNSAHSAARRPLDEDHRSLATRGFDASVRSNEFISFVRNYLFATFVATPHCILLAFVGLLGRSGSFTACPPSPRQKEHGATQASFDQPKTLANSVKFHHLRPKSHCSHALSVSDRAPVLVPVSHCCRSIRPASRNEYSPVDGKYTALLPPGLFSNRGRRECRGRGYCKQDMGERRDASHALRCAATRPPQQSTDRLRMLGALSSSLSISTLALPAVSNAMIPR